MQPLAELHKRAAAAALVVQTAIDSSPQQKKQQQQIVLMLLDALDEADEGGKGYEPVTRLIANE